MCLRCLGVYICENVTLICKEHVFRLWHDIHSNLASLPAIWDLSQCFKECMQQLKEIEAAYGFVSVNKITIMMIFVQEQALSWDISQWIITQAADISSKFRNLRSILTKYFYSPQVVLFWYLFSILSYSQNLQKKQIGLSAIEDGTFKLVTTDANKRHVIEQRRVPAARRF